jgi:hypothetical protein
MENPEIEIYVEDIAVNVFNKLNSSDLKKDLWNNNIHDTVLRFEEYVGNRPSDCEDEFHEDDTWAIDCLTKDGQCVTSYLYVSQYEYNQDYELLKKYV